MLLTPGTRLGPYTIESLIGSGGMGEVYKAHDGRLNRTVAIKRMIADDVSRFQSEARAIAAIINVVDPGVIVLGGGLSNIARLYDRVPALWGAHVFSDRVDTRLVRAAHGDASGVRGAAWLWPVPGESHAAGSDVTRVEGPAS